MSRAAMATLVPAYLLLAATNVLAGPADLQGTSAEQQGRANPVSNAAEGVASVVMNPARIGFGAKSQLFGILVSGDRAKIALLERTPGADIASSIYRARSPDGSPLPHNQATEDLPSRRSGRSGLATEAGVVLGLVVPVWKDRLSVGFMGYLPAKRPASQTYYVDEREAVFSNRLRYSLHEDDHGSQLLAGAIAYKPTPWLRLGLTA